ncbi:MAG: GrpB family protein [Leptolyngbya sp. DLM2.Bin27]|nr:MAG: GrpB family protein [Leptolyngbya sp. DLM2.Bin27]
MRVQVHPPNPQWPQAFAAEAAQVAQALGNNVVQVHHIGSTAIPGIYAKPVIDLLAEVHQIDRVEAANDAMAALGYTALGEYGLPGRRYFRKDDRQGDRTHHVHTFQVGSSEVARHLAFRDFMVAYPDYAQQYSDLKRDLAAQYPNDIEGYMDGKDEFVKAMEQRAMQWRRLA